MMTPPCRFVGSPRPQDLECEHARHARERDDERRRRADDVSRRRARAHDRPSGLERLGDGVRVGVVEQPRLDVALLVAGHPRRVDRGRDTGSREPAGDRRSACSRARTPGDTRRPSARTAAPGPQPSAPAEAGLPWRVGGSARAANATEPRDLRQPRGARRRDELHDAMRRVRRARAGLPAAPAPPRSDRTRLPAPAPSRPRAASCTAMPCSAKRATPSRRSARPTADRRSRPGSRSARAMYASCASRRRSSRISVALSRQASTSIPMSTRRAGSARAARREDVLDRRALVVAQCTLELVADLGDERQPAHVADQPARLGQPAARARAPRPIVAVLIVQSAASATSRSRLSAITASASASEAELRSSLAVEGELERAHRP